MSTAKPWCGLYVKKQVDSDVTCRPGIVMEGICTNETKISLSWPPVVELKATREYIQINLQYEFISCLNNQKTSYRPPTYSLGNIEA